MTNLFNFEKLATLAIERELRKHASLVKDFNVGITIFQTEHFPKEGKRTVTVWFEIRSSAPIFWDVKPVIVIYEGHNLYLHDICERAATYFEDASRLLRKRFVKQFIPRSI